MIGRGDVIRPPHWPHSISRFPFLISMIKGQMTSVFSLSYLKEYVKVVNRVRLLSSIRNMCHSMPIVKLSRSSCARGLLYLTIRHITLISIFLQQPTFASHIFLTLVYIQWARGYKWSYGFRRLPTFLIYFNRFHTGNWYISALCEESAECTKWNVTLLSCFYSS